MEVLSKIFADFIYGHGYFDDGEFGDKP